VSGLHPSELALWQVVFGSACHGPEDPALLTRLVALGVGAKDSAELIRQWSRLMIYRELVRSNVRRTISSALPQTTAVLGQDIDAHVDVFLQRPGPSSPYLRDICREFYEHRCASWNDDESLPRWLDDLARYELARFEVAALPDAISVEGDPSLHLDVTLRFCPACRLLRLRHAVFQKPLPGTRDARVVATRSAVLVHRDSDCEVRQLELSPLAADVVESLMADNTLRRAVVRSCQVHGVAMDTDLLEAIARLLADLAERGIVVSSGEPPLPR